MKIVNRGFIRVKGKQPYMEWVSAQDDEFLLDENAEANIYLIEEDFFEIEPLIEANFKRIFKNELKSVSEDTETYPEITLEQFLDWFDVEVGNAVFDCEKGSLKTD